VKLRQFIPFFDTDARGWSLEARLLRWLTFLWLLVGLVVMLSASYAIADAEFDDGLHFVKLQIFWILLGMVGFNFIVHAPLKFILSITEAALLLVLGFILITLIPGVGISVNGATRWLFVGPFPIQPSELIKPFLILQSARVFGQWKSLTWSVRLFWLGVFCLVLVGILLQPNLSTTALCGISIWLVALASGLPYTYLLATAGSGFLMALVSVTFREYQRRRIMSFLNPWEDPRGDGYQLIQSILAVGSGGVNGTGFGLSQQKLFYLPIQYTDFIFSVFAEEFGFVGGMSLLIMLAAYATLSLRVATKAQNPTHRLIAIGAMIFLVGQSIINIGVATGVLPTTGLPLPFFSYGGNSMLASLFIAALLIRTARESNEAQVIALPTRATRSPQKSPAKLQPKPQSKPQSKPQPTSKMLRPRSRR